MTQTQDNKKWVNYCRLDDGKIRLISNDVDALKNMGVQLTKAKFGFTACSESKDGREIAKWPHVSKDKTYYTLVLDHAEADRLKWLEGKLLEKKDSGVSRVSPIEEFWAKDEEALKNFEKFKYFWKNGMTPLLHWKINLNR